MKSFALTYPDLLPEWDREKNSLTPDVVSARSGKRIWWLCSKGHSFEATCDSRGRGRGCPVCSNKRVVSGLNDLATTHPELAAQWDFEANDFAPTEISAGSAKKVSWLCSVGHSYVTTCVKRRLGNGCPLCSNQVVSAGVNDIATTHPEIAAFWDLQKNELLPSQVSSGSGKKIWWLCSVGHSFEATCLSQSRGGGCPICLNKTFGSKGKSLVSDEANLVAQWDFEKNVLKPSEISSGSGKKVWWLCTVGHSYEASCQARMRGRGCPICSNKKVVAGINDLATSHPELAAEWDTSKNAKSPNQVGIGSKAKVWWLCPNGHSYSSVPYSRKAGTACPICSNKKVVAGINDLATTHPELAAEWDTTKNTLALEAVTGGSGRKAWWLCPDGHSYQSTISHRSLGTSCSTCAKHGFDSARPATLYFIRSEKYSARKIGITNSGNTRSRVSGFGNDWSVIRTYESDDGLAIRRVEEKVFSWLRNEAKLPIYLTQKEMGSSKGYTETFSSEGPSDIEIIERIEMYIADAKHGEL